MTLPLRNSRIKLSQGQIFWREVGQGPILVFLHGSAHDSSQWLPVIDCLSRDYHCFAPDLLGFGDSERPNIHYSIELEVECLGELLEALNQREVYLIAHSLGGWIAASFALKYLEQVRGLVLIAPIGVEAEGLRTERSRPSLFTSLFKRLSKVISSGSRSLIDAINRVSNNRLFARKQTGQKKRRQEQPVQFPTTDKLLFQRRRAEIQAELLKERLEWLKVPVLILQGDRDNRSRIAESQAYADLTPSAQLEIIGFAGNDLPEALPDVVAQYIRDFVSKQ
ncbi:alpha/beta hydrolase [Coleofasciculus sp. FACHB-1120]|uniref:alpha/beta fold hydrolase n=1 Tax=Coleofasciculus sp. FACHB-1120 TaxID=2692783 RepID=UPI0016896BFA|nr:alpha/beta hydrolase [Coleofasciculus sp. FACHB-1120]MBD2740165.1 alpha/beta hydrolase [Coleofasciculus sp. FACHB-1120]